MVIPARYFQRALATRRPLPQKPIKAKSPVPEESPGQRRDRIEKGRYHAPGFPDFLFQVKASDRAKFYGEPLRSLADQKDLILLSEKLYLMSLRYISIREALEKPELQEFIDFHRLILEKAGLLYHALIDEFQKFNNPYAARELLNAYPDKTFTTANRDDLVKAWLKDFPTNVGDDGKGISVDLMNELKSNGKYLRMLREFLSLYHCFIKENCLINTLIDEDLKSGQAKHLQEISKIIDKRLLGDFVYWELKYSLDLRRTKTLKNLRDHCGFANCMEKLAQYIDYFAMAEISQAREKVATSYSAESKQALIAVLNSWNLNGQFNEQIESLTRKSTV